MGLQGLLRDIFTLLLYAARKFGYIYTDFSYVRLATEDKMWMDFSCTYTLVYYTVLAQFVVFRISSVILPEQRTDALSMQTSCKVVAFCKYFTRLVIHMAFLIPRFCLLMS
jgi:hypothetical protein